MTTIELRASIHEMIDRFQDEELLQTIYDLLKSRENSESRKLWSALTPQFRIHGSRK